jgi:LacI family transcriptional regulator
VEYNISFDPNLLFVCDLTDKAGADAAGFILNLEKSERPDAVFSANDTAAVNCMMRLKENGILIPDEIAFAGFNNDPISMIIEPNLTTMDYSGVEIGKIAATNIINGIQEEKQTNNVYNITLKSELIIRKSSIRK